MWVGLIALCIAGTGLEDLPDTACIQYISPAFETEQECQVAVLSALFSEDMQLMLSLPDPDLEVAEVRCRVAI
jgi:hypothetical protein